MSRDSILEKNLIIGKLNVQNRVVFQPMEGCDCNLDGSPSELTEKKYMSFAKSKAGIIWFEANAICLEGRTNPRQMMITKDNISSFKNLLKQIRETSLKEFGYAPLCFIQLTHSGRQSIKPMIMYRNEVYEKTRPVTDENIVTDEYLDFLPYKFKEAALLAKEAGFDGVDVKCCHGYLMQESLSAFNRPGKYGGSFENRTRLYLSCFKAVKEAVGDNYLVVSRFDPSDMVRKPFGFGTDEDGNLDLTESIKLIKELHKLGLDFINITLGNPYFNPHVNRPFRVGTYKPDETPEVGLKRFYDVGKILKKNFPDIIFVGSGLSYYKENLLDKANELLNDNCYDLVGFGRETLAYPNFYKDYLNGNYDVKKACLACGKCTELMRGHRIAGCAIHNEYYRNLYIEMKKEQKVYLIH